jgi:murein L,D-transpeptidase YcbB/YkuD
MRNLENWYRPSYLLKFILFTWLVLFFFTSCNDRGHVHVGEKEVVEKPEEINNKAEEIIQVSLKEMLENSKEINDSFKIKNPSFVHYLYVQNSFDPLWTSEGKFLDKADSLIALIDSSRIYGLFPEDYYSAKLHSLKAQLSDTAAKDRKLDASLWSYMDMLLTSSFVKMAKDLRAGRLLPDSVLVKDSVISNDFFQKQLKVYQQSNNVDFTTQLEPSNPDYQKLKDALHPFLRKADFRKFTLVSSKDSTKIPALLYKRLREQDSALVKTDSPDSIQLYTAISRYQKKLG